MWELDTEFNYVGLNERKTKKKIRVQSYDFDPKVFKQSKKVRFKLVNDDGYEDGRGYMTAKTAKYDPFRPLDEFGKGGWGSTEIHLWEKRGGKYGWRMM